MRLTSPLLILTVLGVSVLTAQSASALGHSSSMPASDPPRVAAARQAKEAKLIEICKKAKIPYPPPEVFFRAFKDERTLEIWAAPKAGAAMRLLAKYNIAGMSGQLGPKRIEGDKQVPEGFYYIDRFNHQSRFLLSLGLNYPNTADRVFSDKEKPGGDIFIHGNTCSIGCLAMTDDKIQEIYLLADGARNVGQKKILVHIFPGRMDDSKWEVISGQPNPALGLAKFWAQLKKGYDAFETTKRPPKVAVRKDGSYVVTKVLPTTK